MKNTKNHSKVKHIDIRHYISLRELVAEGSISIEQITCTENLAYLFTKPLPRDHYHQLLQALNIQLRLTPVCDYECEVGLGLSISSARNAEQVSRRVGGKPALRNFVSIVTRGKKSKNCSIEWYPDEYDTDGVLMTIMQMTIMQ